MIISDILLYIYLYISIIKKIFRLNFVLPGNILISSFYLTHSDLTYELSDFQRRKYIEAFAKTREKKTSTDVIFFS